MLDVKINIQLFGGNGDTVVNEWTAGVTKTAIMQTLENFDREIENADNAIRAYAKVDGALSTGWSGQDCLDYIQKFHEHADKVINQIDEYKDAVHAQVNLIINEWDEFQKNLIVK